MAPAPAEAQRLELTPDELLTTTRAVRRRLDLSRPVPRELIRECVEVALQAPAGSNMVSVRFVAVDDRATIEAIAAVYNRCFQRYREQRWYVGKVDKGSAGANRQQRRTASSAEFLDAHIAEVPALVLACHEGGRADERPARIAAAIFGNVLPATWSFMLAARARGLGTAWTGMHLPEEAEVAGILGIPHERVQQAVLTPVAFALGTEFRPAARPPVEEVLHWNRWQSEGGR
jgi:nitroreductase